MSKARTEPSSYSQRFDPDDPERCSPWLDTLLSYIFGATAARHWRRKLTQLAVLEAVFASFAILDLFTNGRISTWGIHPRHAWSLLLLIIAPLLHTSFYHFLVNAIPFFVLGAFVLLRPDGDDLFAILTLGDALIGGFAVWLIGSQDTVHVGSSGLIFCYFGFLLVFGLASMCGCGADTVVRTAAAPAPALQDQEEEDEDYTSPAGFRATVTSAVVFCLYAGLFWGFFPKDEQTSWESHIAGFLIGSAVGILHARGALGRLFKYGTTRRVKDIINRSSSGGSKTNKHNPLDNDDDLLDDEGLDYDETAPLTGTRSYNQHGHGGKAGNRHQGFVDL